MFRAVSISTMSLSALFSGAALGADYPELFRGSYEAGWQDEELTDPLEFEMGLRYWYSKGSSSLDFGPDSYSSDDTSHILEGHVRIDDLSTSSYLKGAIGYAALVEGDYSTPTTGGAIEINGGRIAYGVADFGVMPFGSDTVRFGGFVGYQYWNDSPDMGRESFVTPSGAGDSEVNDLGIHALRLGIAAKAELSDMVDFTAEAAVIPYAYMYGTYGALDIPGFTAGGVTYQQGSAGTLEGMLQGATVEAMLGFHPTDSLALRVGGRAWYVGGKPDVSFTATEVGTPANAVNFIGNTVFEAFRYGALAELTYTF